MSDPHIAVDSLLIEDNDGDAEPCIRVLRKRHRAGNLAWVKDGAKALELLFSTGDPVKQEADEWTHALPIAGLTSSREERDIVEACDRGVSSFISRPVRFEAFVDVVAEPGCHRLVVNQAPTGGREQ